MCAGSAAVSSAFVPVRVLWLIKGLGPGGAETLLAAAARAHDHDAFHIECAYVLPYKDHLAEQLEQAGVRCHCLSTTRSDPRWPMRLRRLIAAGQFDIVHSHSPLPAAVGRIVATSLPRARRPTLVSTEHNAWDTFATPTRWANRLTSRLDDAVYAVSNETKRSMRGRTAGRCVTLQHGIDVESVAALAGQRTAVRSELGIGADEFVIGTVANYRTQKAYPNLLHAADALRQRGVEARVVAVGQGPLEREIVTLRDQLGLDGFVLLTGYRADASRVMAAFDLFTLASTYEGLPVALMQAFALGLPVAATRVGGVAEVLTDDDAILVAPDDAEALADAWVHVLSSPELASTLAERSRHLAEGFDASIAVGEYESCYRRLAPPDRSVHAEAEPAKPSPARTNGLDIRPATPGDRSAILELGRASLGWGDDPRYEQLFAWKHDDNAFGPSYMWVATDGDRVVGLRAFMRWEFVRGGEVLRAVRAVDTATHPDYQGRGLFTAMTMHGLDEVRGDGVDFVFNTPNEQSRPGYLKMGWETVGNLPVAVRVRNPASVLTVAKSRVASSLWPTPLDEGASIEAILERREVAPEVTHDPRALATNRSNAFVSWRYGAPFLGYRAVESDRGVVIVRLRSRGGADELVLLDAFDLDVRASDRVATSVMRNSGATHALRIGPADPRRGFVGYPGGGPMLTWRGVNSKSKPPLPNWCLTMGDIELF